MTREEFFEIHHKYHLRLTGHQIWIGYLYHITNLDSITIENYRIIYFNQSKSDPSKENFEKLQKYILKIKENEISKRINNIKGDFQSCKHYFTLLCDLFIDKLRFLFLYYQCRKKRGNE